MSHSMNTCMCAIAGCVASALGNPVRICACIICLQDAGIQSGLRRFRPAQTLPESTASLPIHRNFGASTGRKRLLARGLVGLLEAPGPQQMLALVRAGYAGS